MPGPKIQIHFENYAEIHFEVQKSTLKSRNPLVTKMAESYSFYAKTLFFFFKGY